jgi:Ca2+-binding EF-hand superfamily protein
MQRSVPTFLFAVIFDFYDADGDGSLTESELLRISGPLFRLCFGGDQSNERQARDVSRHLPTFPMISDTLDGQHAKRVFQQFDRNGDKKLSFDEFKSGYKNDSVLRPVSAAQLYPPNVALTFLRNQQGLLVG